MRRRFPSGPLHSSLNGLAQFDLPVEKVVRSIAAKVVVADYDLIRNDFRPHLDAGFRRRYCRNSCEACAASNGSCADAIDKWLLHNAAVVSHHQTTQTAVNSEIVAEDIGNRAFRPPAYGRALVVEVFRPGHPAHARYVDVKGAGVAPGVSPNNLVHGNGLEYLGFALADYFYGWLVDLAFMRSVPTYYVVPTYAVIDLGFDISGGWVGTAPAGVHVRRAHMRYPTGAQLPLSGTDAERVACQMELLLRLFGLTSTTDSTSFKLDRASDEISYFGDPVTAADELEAAKLSRIRSYLDSGKLEVTNIQLIRGANWADKSAQLVDFGNINARHRFKHPFAIGARDGRYRVSRLIGVGDKEFVQPVEAVALDGSLFARETVNSIAFYAAQGFRTGRLSRRDILRTLLTGIKRSGFHRKPV